MLSQADKDFLTLEREQKAQAQSDISDISSQSADEEEVEEEVEASSAHIYLKIEKIQEEICPIVVVPQKKPDEALKLLKNAFEQIKLALSLLNDQETDSQPLREEVETLSQTIAPVAAEVSVVPNEKETFASKAKKPVAPVAEESVIPNEKETSASKAKKPVATVAAEVSVVPNAKETFASKAKKPVATVAAEESVVPNAKETSASKAKKPVVSVAVMSSPTNVKDDEFKVVMPKKSKIKGTAPITETENDKKDDFPSLGSSFSPVQKAGFWSSGKNSLEIAKSVAQIPSPPPTRSPTLPKIIKARGGSREPIDEDEDDSDENGDDYWE